MYNITLGHLMAVMLLKNTLHYSLGGLIHTQPLDFVCAQHAYRTHLMKANFWPTCVVSFLQNELPSLDMKRNGGIT